MRLRRDTRKTLQGVLIHTTENYEKEGNSKVSIGVGHLEISSAFGLSSFSGYEKPRTELKSFKNEWEVRK